MTEDKIRSSREYMKARVSIGEWWEKWWRNWNFGLIGAGFVVALSLGAIGKPAAEIVGNVTPAAAELTPEELSKAKTTGGWRLACFTVAFLVAAGHIAGRKHIEAGSQIARARTLNAALKNLIVDLEDNKRDAKEVTRDYQRLTEKYPEFVD